MQKIIILIIAISISVACKAKKKIVKTENPNENTEQVVEKNDAKAVVEIDTTGTVLFWIERDICFGACPSYKAEVFENGTVKYLGRKFVDNEGLYFGKMSEQDMQELAQLAETMNFVSLEKVYDNRHVTDLPASSVFASYKGKYHTIMCRFDCPNELVNFMKVLDKKIKESNLVKAK